MKAIDEHKGGLSSLNLDDFYLIFEDMEEGVNVFSVIYDNKGNVIDLIIRYTNPAAIKHNKAIPNEFIGKYITELYDSEIIEQQLEIANDVIKSGKNKTYETYFPKLDIYYSIKAFSQKKELYVTISQDITESKNAENSLIRNKERFKLLSDAASTLLSSESPEKIVSLICGEVMNYLDCHVFFNYLLDEKRQQLQLNEYAGVPKKVGDSIEWLDLGVAVCGSVGRDGCKIIAENIQETSDEHTELVKSFGVKAYACHPIISKGYVIGTLSFGTKSKPHFREDELELMRIITDYIATAMERKQEEEEKKKLLESLQVYNEELENANEELETTNEELKKQENKLTHLNRAYIALSNNSKAIISAANELEYLESVCRIVVEDCDYPMVWIGYAEDDENKTIRPVAYSGFEEGYLKTLNISWADNERGRGPTGMAIRTGKASLCENMLTDSKFKPWRDEAIKRGYASSLVLPLKDKDKPFGTLNIYSREFYSFSPEKVKLMTELANDVAYGINSIRLRVANIKAEEALRAAHNNLELKVHERTMELEKINEELKRSNEELESFAYITSHDLQEPLRSIASYAQLLQRRYKGQLDDDADDFIDFMVNGAKRMKYMIQGLLDYSRVETNGEEFWKFNTENALKNALLNLSSLIIECNAEITYDSLPVILGDESQITRLFQNLIGNALKFRKKGVNPLIHISTDKKDTEYVFSISDNGIGIEKEYTDKIFEVFKRLHTIGEYEGAGIGLAIVKRIVNRHGGHVWVKSKYGEGSTFYFTIPLEIGEFQQKLI